MQHSDDYRAVNPDDASPHAHSPGTDADAIAREELEAARRMRSTPEDEARRAEARRASEAQRKREVAMQEAARERAGAAPQDPGADAPTTS